MNKVRLGLFQQLLSSDQGFSMTEVLIATLTAFAFLIGSLQALAIQAVVKVRAEREAQATYWIQQDLASVTAAASDLADDSATSRCGATVYEKGFAAKLRNNLFNNLEGTGNALDAKTPRYTSVADSPSKNFNVQVAPTRKLVNKDYRLVRIINPDINNINILKITYRVGLPKTDNTEKTAVDALLLSVDPSKLDEVPPSSKKDTISFYDQLQDNALGDTSIIAEQYAEVVPNVALFC